MQPSFKCSLYSDLSRPQWKFFMRFPLFLLFRRRNPSRLPWSTYWLYTWFWIDNKFLDCDNMRILRTCEHHLSHKKTPRLSRGVDNICPLSHLRYNSWKTIFVFLKRLSSFYCYLNGLTRSLRNSETFQIGEMRYNTIIYSSGIWLIFPIRSSCTGIIISATSLIRFMLS